jgi:hypothetical protein
VGLLLVPAGMFVAAVGMIMRMIVIVVMIMRMIVRVPG